MVFSSNGTDFCRRDLAHFVRGYPLFVNDYLSSARRACRLRSKALFSCLMSTPAEIESAIEKLPTDQMLEVASWLDDYRAMLQSSETLFQQLDAEEASVAGQQWLGE